MDYDETVCTIILFFPKSYTIRFNCFDWLIYVVDYDEPLSDFIWRLRLESGAEIISYLEELGFPFPEKLQAFIDYKQKTNQGWLMRKFRPIPYISD
jgi:hypothetical protein